MTWLNNNAEPRYVRIRKSSKTWTSQIFSAEYNCGSRQYRIVLNTLYAGPMATGENFHGSSNGPWRDITDGYEMWRSTFAVACAAK